MRPFPLKCHDMAYFTSASWNKQKQTTTSGYYGGTGVKGNFSVYLWTLQCSSWHVTVAFVCVCARMPARARVLYDREKETRVDKMCPSSLCNYVPIFSPSVAFIIPLRSHLGVGDCHTLAPPSLNVCRMKCRSPPIDLCLPAPASLSPLFVSS